MSQVEARLHALGLELPPAPPPAANYIGWRRSGREIWVAGVGPTWGREIRHAGKVGSGIPFEIAVEAARLTALNLLAHVKEATDGDLDRVAGCLKIFALVNAAADYTEAHLVANGATDLLVALYGDAGRPARSVIIAPSLPMDIAVEMDALFLLKD